MPALTWPGKCLAPVPAASLLTEAVVYPQGRGYPSAPPENRLILGDNLPVMAALLPEYEDRFDLLYADPPFFTNRKYPARIGRGEDSRKPAEWQLTEGYPDHWPDLDAYLAFLYQRLALMVRLLAPHGTLYLHLDWHADAYARLLLDELLGAENLLNEIIWTYHGPSPIRRAFNRKHDTILAYVKGKDYTFNTDAVRAPYNPNTVKTFESSPKAGFGKVPDLKRGKVPEDWWYFPVVARLHNERSGYPTQKPQALLERILLASSNPGDLVGDFFCGSGTTPLAAATLGRRFIACDLTFRALHTTRSRLTVTGAPFTLERDAAAPFPLAEGERAATLSLGSVALDTDGLDYWEVDPAWDGVAFRSAAQAVRPARSDAVPQVLEIKRGGRVCLRWVTIDGQQFQSNV
ncbi:MAG: DNA-methyltransferase [Chloroflexota bacterium]